MGMNRNSLLAEVYGLRNSSRFSMKDVVIGRAPMNTTLFRKNPGPKSPWYAAS